MKLKHCAHFNACFRSKCRFIHWNVGDVASTSLSQLAPKATSAVWIRTEPCLVTKQESNFDVYPRVNSYMTAHVCLRVLGTRQHYPESDETNNSWNSDETGTKLTMDNRSLWIKHRVRGYKINYKSFWCAKSISPGVPTVFTAKSYDQKVNGRINTNEVLFRTDLPFLEKSTA
jgi:hypothetical protein